MEVFVWQLAILMGIGLASVLFGKTGWVLSSLAAAIWTLVTIFTSWLFILQLITVFVGCVIGAVIVKSSNCKDIREGAWALVVVGIIGIWWAVDHFKSKDSQPVSSVAINRESPYAQPNTTTLTQLATNNIEPLEQIITRLEREFPEIDPQSLAYRQNIVDQIVEVADLVETDGFPKGVALEQATRAVIRQLRSSNSASLAQQNPPIVERNVGYTSSRVITGTKEASDYQRVLNGDFSSNQRHIVDSGRTKCVIKPVMTDEDLALCKD